MKDNFKLQLQDNARESLDHALNYLKFDSSLEETKTIKRVILDLIHCLELLLKDYLRNIHPILVYDDIDKINQELPKTVNITKAIYRIQNLSEIRFDIKLLKKCISYRNQIIHYEFEISKIESKVIIGRILSFIFHFLNKELSLDWESDIKKTDVWLTLSKFKNFWEDYGSQLEREHASQDNISVCFFCDRKTFDENISKCLFCEHNNKKIICSSCKKAIWKGEAEIISYGPEDFEDQLLCHFCFGTEMDEAMLD